MPKVRLAARTQRLRLVMQDEVQQIFGRIDSIQLLLELYMLIRSELSLHGRLGLVRIARVELITVDSARLAFKTRLR